ncbi:hypothetical protein SDC9_119783 [bioreactor metagenome]|uniref:Copper amine oxidase-like N-terminal domain-containing protein n=1 Tax=bioreactor metagenome TaxID=1076179 RepID=A0A645C6M2_9ZZZZ
MKKRIATVLICLALFASFCTGALASGNMKAISAYLNSGIKILYNGQTQTMKDAQGNTVYPISYNGTTYVPIRAVSDMLSLPVEWDGANNTVILGTNPEGTDFIDNFTPYSKSEGQFKIRRTADGQSITLAGNTYSNYIWMGDYYGDSGFYGYFNLKGDYEELTFTVYSDYNCTLSVKGDNDSLIKAIPIEGIALPATYTVSVANVQQLCLYCSSGQMYIVNATIK